MNHVAKLLSAQAGATKLALALTVAVAGYLALAGSWATAVFELIDRFGARLPL
jgi:hypothetical protein